MGLKKTVNDLVSSAQGDVKKYFVELNEDIKRIEEKINNINEKLDKINR